MGKVSDTINSNPVDIKLKDAQFEREKDTGAIVEMKVDEQKELQTNIVNKMSSLMDFIQSHCDACPKFKDDFEKLGI